MKVPRLDLSPLDPRRDPEWQRRLGTSVMARVEEIGSHPPPSRRVVEAHDPVGDLLSLARPALIAASVIVTVCVAGNALRLRDRAPSSPDAAYAPDAPRQFPLASAVGLEGPWARWVEEGHSPSASEVLAAARGY